MNSEQRTSYAAVIDRAVRSIRTRCLDYSLSDIEAICPSCAADIAALTELARLVEEAKLIADANVPFDLRGLALIRALAAGFPVPVPVPVSGPVEGGR